MSSPPPTSPPATKRQRTEATGADSTPSFTSAPVINGNGEASSSASRPNGESSNGANTAQALAAPAVAIVDEADDSEPEEEVLPEEEDVSRRDMYLDTVNRANLDFDFERVCSKSLSNINVYACLVCGKFFQGRGRGSWAYRHAVGDNHRVWLNLETEKFYVLPEGYPVSDPSLNDIIAVLHPRYKSSSLPALSSLPSNPAYTLANQPYFPGYIGINNIRRNDYLTVILHLLLHIPPIRSFFLDPNNPQLSPNARPQPTELVLRLATFTRRLWNSKLFKAQISPHEFFQEVTKRSAGKFTTTEQGDPVEFLGWLLNTVHRDLGGTKKRGSSVIYRALQGMVQIQTQQIIVHKEYSRPVFDIGRDTQSITSPFLFLALDLPATPLFQDQNEKKIIPQVAISQILAKFDGNTTQEFGPTLKRHHLLALPPYLVLHIKRFTKNNFVEERNPTIVNYPLRGVELADYVDPKPSDPIHTQYDLLSNISLDTTAASTSSKGTGLGVTAASIKKRRGDELQMTWKIHTRAGHVAVGDDKEDVVNGSGNANGQTGRTQTPEEKWFEMQDLRVEEVRKEMVFLGETVLQVWERRDLSVGRA